MFNNSFSMEFDGESAIFGIFKDNSNNNSIGRPLKNGLQLMFHEHAAEILIANSRAFPVMFCHDKFYFADSHSCGPKGASAQNGKAFFNSM